MSKQSLLEEFEWRCITISSFLERAIEKINAGGQGIWVCDRKIN